MKRGLFIVFEGVEGVGKSTQASLLAKRVSKELKREAILTREPGGTELAEKLRTLVLSHSGEVIDNRTEALIMAAARAHHVSQQIFPRIESGAYVICDRFSGSYLAYQGYGRGLEIETLEIITHFASGGIEPDITFYLDVDPKEAMARKGVSRDRIEAESPDFFEKVARGYAELATRDLWVSLEAGRSVEEIHEQVFAYVLEIAQDFGDK